MYCSISFEVMLPSACSFIVDGLTFWLSLFYTTCFGLHGHLQVCIMFHFYIPEGICLASFVAFVARGYTMQFLICVFVSFLILVCVFAFLPFLVVCQDHLQ
jgi:hypothetical protein